MMIVYGTLGVCAVLVGVLIYRYDLYEKEPVWMLLMAGGLGAVGMWGVGSVEDWVLDLYGRAPRPSVVVAGVASTHEELLKVGLVWLLSVVFVREFEDPMDGLIYGSVVGLGMAVYESMFYLGFAYGETEVLPAAEFVRLCGHPVMGGIGGFGVGMARLKVGRWWVALMGTSAGAVGIHFAWDWVSFTGLRDGQTWWRSLAAVVLMLVGFLVYGRLLSVAAREARGQFGDEGGRSLWGWPFKAAGEG